MSIAAGSRAVVRPVLGRYFRVLDLVPIEEEDSPFVGLLQVPGTRRL